MLSSNPYPLCNLSQNNACQFDAKKFQILENFLVKKFKNTFIFLFSFVNTQYYRDPNPEFNPKYISPTAIMEYVDCPRKALYSSVLGFKPVLTSSLVFGKAFHQVAGHFYENIGKKREPPTPRELLEYFNEILHAYEQIPGITWEETPSDLENTGRKYIALLHAKQKKYEISPLSVEEKLIVASKNTDEVLFGKPDLVANENGRLIIIDNKTRTRLPLPQEVLDSPQLAFYAFLWVARNYEQKDWDKVLNNIYVAHEYFLPIIRKKELEKVDGVEVRFLATTDGASWEQHIAKMSPKRAYEAIDTACYIHDLILRGTQKLEVDKNGLPKGRIPPEFSPLAQWQTKAKRWDCGEKCEFFALCKGLEHQIVAYRSEIREMEDAIQLLR